MRFISFDLITFCFFFTLSSHPVSDYTLPRRTPPLQPKLVMTESYQSLPKSVRRPSASSPPVPRDMPSDYKYAHDRLSHFRMSTDERMAAKEGMVWQLYEWQQRQRFRHGGPVVPSVFTVADYVDAASSSRVMLEVPRSVSVPPSPCEVPPSRLASPRRPHTPADRVTVRPIDEVTSVDVVRSASPRAVSKVRHLELFTIESKLVPGATMLFKHAIRVH